MTAQVAEATLFSYLLTRPTGRHVRAAIEEQIARAGDERRVIAVLDLREVVVIDFSCADEIVAKLVRLARGAESPLSCLLLRGLAQQHREPIQAVLQGQGLVAAAEDADGRPLLMGALDDGPLKDAAAVDVWRAVWRVGRVRLPSLAERLSLPKERVSGALDDLVADALIIRDGDAYVSLAWALRAARR